ncbi:double-strand break repair protein AddB [Aquicoccus sp. G2-2]|uniref:double-strand break repair protein AddB n=1 Tax=Aquicoccus sp. G2-2 TaxID=3092120 RepID=UPI002AE010A6|nr:double-strand break repair protein AddB [Aquicoccus sp. G2-2]MEA1114729.1 double-strand break repair protein AddB [Aquicoccus sp. G2-2]
MFEPASAPRVFALAPGVDFAKALVQGLLERNTDQPPEAIARVELIVNTRRMARQIHALFDEGPASFLPRIRLVTDLGEDVGLDIVPPAVAPLRRQLELTRLVSSFLDAAPEFAPRSALFDLADSLAALMGEMQGEGVSPATIAALEVDDQSGHWARTQAFLGIVQQYFDTAQTAPDPEARQRRIAEHLTAQWETAPPDHPIIIAGSTGSRGATQLLMQAVARLPQGALVLPGFDFDMPGDLWQEIDNPLIGEDHPQYRFQALMNALRLSRNDIREWVPVPAPNPARNRLVSLALRPAPVTDQWLRDGPALAPEIATATQEMTLLEAPTQRDEALAIALRLRKAAEAGEAAALITPDRMLTRQVSAALDRWNILPDDSAGEPLPLSPIGRLLRHAARLFEERLTAESLLTVLKHPLTHSAAGRGDHLRLTRDLELHLRSEGSPYPNAATLRKWAAARKVRDADAWVEWLCTTLTNRQSAKEITLSDRLETHITLVEALVRGSDLTVAASLWDHADGLEAKRIIDNLRDAADAGGALSARDYSDLFGAILASGEVREVETPHPHILIWGTLEARVQGVDLLILAGLNEGGWPEAPTPDPWLNRRMRHQAGLLLPERRIGLSAHDFQQAIGAKEVWLSRSLKSDEAETVASRWLNRLTNLLNGLGDPGQNAFKEMTKRGAHWLALAAALEETGEPKPAHRPAPRPPLAARPRQLSVTAIQKLIRDPYAIYARYVLGLRPLDPLMREPDALGRGIVLHRIMERFIFDIQGELTRDRLLSIAREELEEHVPWPAARLIWLARIERVADSFIADESKRQTAGRPVTHEVNGAVEMVDPVFKLTGQADRIDRQEDGALIIYDYKTGTAPSATQQKHFDKQLLLEAVIAEQGGFRDIPATRVNSASYIALGSKPGEVPVPLDEQPTDVVWEQFRNLITRYLSPDQGFLARRAMFESRNTSDYDLLARFGEWDISHPPSQRC